MAEPLITVLMPVHNAAAYVTEAAQSILNQTGVQLELLVIDDGSTDDSIERILAIGDARVRILRNAARAGVTASLNRGLQEARGEYIARMDADDIAAPGRLAKQAARLNERPQLGLVASYLEEFPRRRVPAPPTDPARVKIRLLTECILGHPTVMMRKSALAKHGLVYRAEYPHAEDYDLWVRLSRVADLEILPEVLLRYRIHPAQISAQKKAEQLQSTERIRRAQLAELGFTEADPDYSAVCNAAAFRPDPDLSRAAQAAARLMLANLRTGLFDAALFAERMGEYLEACALRKTRWFLHPARLGAAAWRKIAARMRFRAGS